ncbi:MAG: glycosyltransferase family 2 protein [Bacteroidia bacterium]
MKEMKGSLVSVIMPAYNCEKFVQQAIDSVLNQSYSNFELLVADDCSKDKTKEIIDSYSDPRIKRFHNETNLGYLKASNKLFHECKGEFITFQDADDYSSLTRIERMLEFFRINAETDALGSNVVKVNESGELKSQTDFPLVHEEIVRNFEKYKIVFTGSALMIRKKLISEHGIYNEYFDRIGSEDIYWFSRIIQRSRVANLSEALYFYRFNSNSVTLNHKNPKAFVGHDLILLLYKRRKKGKEDYIETKRWEAADVCCEFLSLIKGLNEKRKPVKDFCSLLMQHPLTGSQFIRAFISGMRHCKQLA